MIVQPATVIKWHQNLSKKIWAEKSICNAGRKPTDKEIIEIIKRMAQENYTWGASRIHGELLKLGIKISERTVARYLPKDRPRGPNWSTFLRNQANGIIALDLFTVFTQNFKMLFGIVIMDHGRRKILLTNATFNPTQHWVTQQVLNALPGSHPYHYLIVDNDSRFSTYFSDEISSLLEIKVVKTSMRSPWQNGIIERAIGTIRRECTDHIIISCEELTFLQFRRHKVKLSSLVHTLPGFDCQA